jgi:diadenosine tetraphosphate (Ap4A) HIT family hydrolase
MQQNEFKLHPTLTADTCFIADLPLCRLLLSNDSNYPWGILVPRRGNISEIYQLSDIDQQRLLLESSTLSQCLQSTLNPDKLNIAALGNVVPQLHIHHIARYKHDKAWPAPIWGHSKPTPYTPEHRDKLLADVRSWLRSNTTFFTE